MGDSVWRLPTLRCTRGRWRLPPDRLMRLPFRRLWSQGGAPGAQRVGCMAAVWRNTTRDVLGCGNGPRWTQADCRIRSPGRLVGTDILHSRLEPSGGMRYGRRLLKRKLLSLAVSKSPFNRLRSMRIDSQHCGGCRVWSLQHCRDDRLMSCRLVSEGTAGGIAAASLCRVPQRRPSHSMPPQARLRR